MGERSNGLVGQGQLRFADERTIGERPGIFAAWTGVPLRGSLAESHAGKCRGRRINGAR